MNVQELNIVTASVDSGATEAVGAGSSTWPVLSSPGKGYEVAAPQLEAPTGKNHNQNLDQPKGAADLNIVTDCTDDPLRLRGGGDSNPPSSSNQPIIKRKNPEASPESVRLKNHFDEIDIAITTTRAILEEMVVVGKVCRKWNDLVSHQLDEILITFRNVAEESASAIGQINARREDLYESIARNRELYQDIGSQKTKMRQLENEIACLERKKSATRMETDAIVVLE